MTMNLIGSFKKFSYSKVTSITYENEKNVVTKNVKTFIMGVINFASSVHIKKLVSIITGINTGLLGVNNLNLNYKCR